MEKSNKRSAILKAAAKVFADNGYEGASVDEISKEAGVTKSLLYYHFKSKDEIFEVLVDQLFQEYKRLMTEARDVPVAYESEPLKKRMKNVYFPFGAENENLVRCAFIESLKRKQSCNVFIEMVELQRKDTDDAAMEKLVLEYFFNIIPCVVFLCQKEAWSAYYHIDEEKLGSVFLDQYDKMHGYYHRNEKKI